MRASAGPGGRRAKSPGVRAAQRTFAIHERSRVSGVPAAELRGELAQRGGARERGLTRRELIVAGAGIAAGAALAGSPASAAARAFSRRSAPRIAIVGAGLAGLSCAYELWSENPAGAVAASVFEANGERSGGRCWTLRDFFQDGLITEHGGAFLNSDQVNVRSLAARLGLEEEIYDGGDLPQGEEVFFIDGALYTVAEADAEWESFAYGVIRQAQREANSGQQGEERLDSLSVPEWLDSTEIGSGSRLGRLMLADTVTENGGDPADQSALDLIELLSANRRTDILPLSGVDEKFHIVGGNDRLVSGMIERLPPETVKNGHVLVAVRQNADRTTTLSFQTGAATIDATFDFVVFALPFSTLRDVDLSKAGFSKEKLHAIRTMGMGTNAKVHLELSHKTWPALGYAGAMYQEWNGLACGWDDCPPRGPDASPAIYCAFPGAVVGRTGLTGEAHGVAPPADADWALSAIENVFTGTVAAYTGRSYEDHWWLDPWVRGAYSYYRVGQAATYGSINPATEGRCYFAGEHCASENLGFLDGAVETGQLAAKRIINRVG